MNSESSSLEAQASAALWPRLGISWRRFLATNSARDSTLWLCIGCVWAFFYFFTEGSFLAPRNLVVLALQTSIVSLAAIRSVVLIAPRNFDLSVGCAVALVGGLC